MVVRMLTGSRLHMSPFCLAGWRIFRHHSTRTHYQSCNRVSSKDTVYSKMHACIHFLSIFQLVNYSIGFAICFAIGLLFVIFLPLCGCCICCCRCCCGNCGGDLKAVSTNNGMFKVESPVLA